MEGANESVTQNTLGENSQVARLGKITKRTKLSLIIGAVLLFFVFISGASYVANTYVPQPVQDRL